VDGLVVDHDRPPFERARRERSLKQPERAAQDDDGQDGKDEKGEKFGAEDVPVN
jgi:hypothetical protein